MTITTTTTTTVVPVRAAGRRRGQPGYARCSYSGERRFIPGWQAGHRTYELAYDGDGIVKRMPLGVWILERDLRQRQRALRRRSRPLGGVDVATGIRRLLAGEPARWSRDWSAP